MRTGTLSAVDVGEDLCDNWDPAWGGCVGCPLATSLQLLVEPLHAPAPLSLEVPVGHEDVAGSRAAREQAHQHLDTLGAGGVDACQ